MQCHNLIYVALYVCFAGSEECYLSTNQHKTWATCDYSATSPGVEKKFKGKFNYMLEKIFAITLFKKKKVLLNNWVIKPMLNQIIM